MLFVTIAALGSLVAFFFYHKTVVMRLKNDLMDMEVINDMIELLKLDQAHMESSIKMITATQEANKKTRKKKKGRPVNPNSTHQKRLRAKLNKSIF
jgi:uncharacterized protein (DUF2147 family)